MVWAIKIREKGQRAWFFLKPDGTSSRLKIYASRFSEKAKADQFVATNAAINSGLDMKVVEL